MENKKYVLKLDLKRFFPGGVIPTSFMEYQRHKMQLIKLYDEARTKLINVSGSENLVNIIEEESGDYDRRMAFFETTTEAVLYGADYSGCKTIDDMAKVYSSYLLRICGF